MLQPASCQCSDLEEEIAQIENIENSVIDPDGDAAVEWALHYPLSFLIDTTKTDREQLQKKFKQQRIEATQAYQKGNFLEVTLHAFQK